MADGSDPLFSLDIVRDFIVLNGGKVSNHELVSHFKHFLNDPRRKVANRQKFKTFVNTLASVKLDVSGEKLLVLKRKFRDSIYSSSGSCGAASGETEGGDAAAEKQNVPPKKAKVESDADTAGPTEDVSNDTVPVGAEAASGTEQEPEEAVEKTSPEGPHATETGQESAAADANVAEADKQTTLTTESSASVASDDAIFVDAVEQLPAAKEDTEASAAAEEKESAKELSPAAEVNDNAETSPSTEGRDSVFSEVASEAESLPSPDDVARAAVEAAMAPDVGEEKDTDSPDASSESDALVTPMKQMAAEGGTPSTPMSVKERAKHLNRMESQTELEKTTPATAKTPKEFKPNERRSTEEKDESQTSGSVSLDSNERQWLVLAATTDYHPMAKILLTNAHLVRQKTALHWAAKLGKPEVVKLLCGTQGNNVNARSGYTPLHLATMNRHEAVIEMLVQVYGANPNIRDYSGKKAKQYLSNTMSSHTQQILQSRHSTIVSKSQNESRLHRIASNSARLFRVGQMDATSTVRGAWKHHSASPSPAISPAPSPVIARKASLPDRPDMMPPPRHLPSMRSRKRSKNQNKDVPVRSHSESPHMWKHGSEPELRNAGSSVFV